MAKTAKPPLQSEGYLLQFAATFVPTILIELVILLLFGFKLKENWKPFLLVNLVTQGLLHGYFALFAVNNGVGPWYFMLFIPAELVIALLEAFIYRAALKGRSKRRAFLCGLCATSAQPRSAISLQSRSGDLLYRSAEVQMKSLLLPCPAR